MGQYFIIVNLDKKEYLYPHQLGDGLKIWEIIHGGGTLRALGLLLHERWAGDRIAIVGDYGTPGIFIKDNELNLYYHAKKNFKNISLELREELIEEWDINKWQIKVHERWDKQDAD